MSDPRVLLTGCAADVLNLNAGIRHYLFEGFSAIGGATVESWPRELAETAIARFRPHLVVAIGSLVPDAPGLGGLRRAADRVGAAFALWLHDDPYEFDYAFKAELRADIVFSNDRWACAHYRHDRVHHLPLAASPRHHLRELKPLDERTLDLFFCGVAYPNRIDFLRRADAMLSRRRVAILGADWPASLRCASNRRLTVAEMADFAQDARLTLNLGRDMDIANRRYQLPPSTPGPRTFEVALSGSAQAYFVRDLEIERHFRPGEEIYLIDGIDDLARLFDRLADAPQQVYAVAARAQARALSEHTYAHRAQTMLQTCLSDWTTTGGGP